MAVSFLNHYLKYCSVKCKIFFFSPEDPKMLKKKKREEKISNLLQAKNCDSNSLVLKLSSNPTKADWRGQSFSLIYQDYMIFEAEHNSFPDVHHILELRAWNAGICTFSPIKKDNPVKGATRSRIQLNKVELHSYKSKN